MPGRFLTLILAALLASSCQKEDGTRRSSSSNGAGGTTYGGAVTGKLNVSEGANAESVAGAKLLVENKPEIEATTKPDGTFAVNNVLPGTLVIYALSKDATSLTSGGSAYGVKLADVVVKDGQTTDVGEHEFKKTGGIKGKVEFLDNPNGLDLSGTDVYIPGVSSMLVKTDDQGAFTLTGLPEGTYTVHIFHTGFAVSKLMDIQVTAGQITQLDPVMLSLSTGPEGNLAIAAEASKKIGGSEKKIHKSRTVTMNLSFDSDTALMKISDEPSFLNKQWMPVAKTYTWTFTSDGAKTLYVMFSDLNGLESSPLADNVIIDTEAPILNAATILYNWATTAASENPLALDVEDSGTGIAEIRLSYTDENFSDNLDWQPYTGSPKVEVGNTAGNKTVYVQVRDYAGRESGVVNDSITRGTYTEITPQAYNENMVLAAAQSPYTTSGTVTFNGNLTIEPGTKIYGDLTHTNPFTVKGVLTAIGTDQVEGSGLILFEAAAGGTRKCQWKIDLTASPGVSERHRLKNVEFRRIAEITVNGGRIESSKFDGTGCDSIHGGVTKSGKDPFVMENNVFANWRAALTAKDGNNASTLKGSTGDVTHLLVQQETASNTTITDNNIDANNSSYTVIHIEAGNLTSTSTNNRIGTINGSVNPSILLYWGNENLVISGLTVNNCDAIVSNNQATGGSITMTNSTFTNCRAAVKSAASAWPITFSHNDILINEALIASEGNVKGTITFDRNDITLNNNGDGTYFADLVSLQKNASNAADFSAVFSNNNIDCQTANGCRGGISSNCGSGACTQGIGITLDQNYYSDKTEISGISTLTCGANNIYCGSTGEHSGVGRYQDTAIRIYEFATAHNGTNAESVWSVSATGVSATPNSPSGAP